ncbi:hypothetical protein JW319_10915 [Enterobacter cloacae subsp. cloacae]|uniref:hypothetical protein n=1 Tax=Enterobacter cloacae TaxID=550 RepID=UPI001C5B3398|nr:hypothetical protein [Enterobacter cloacae]MBW4201883.1 hypothetical protein [Enterobacter cloacae subsp. cloacae]
MVFPPLLHDVIRRAPDISAYPTFAEMTENTALMHARYPELVTITEVGISAQGIPINMISIGNFFKIETSFPLVRPAPARNIGGEKGVHNTIIGMTA